jgi:hypothetical protein
LGGASMKEGRSVEEAAENWGRSQEEGMRREAVQRIASVPAGKRACVAPL